MESPPKLGLGTIYITPLHGMTNLTTEVWFQSLGTSLGRCQAPKTAQLMGWFSLIMFYVLIALKAHSTLHSRHIQHYILYSHTHQHSSSKQHGINYPKTLTYTYHGNSHQTQHTSIASHSRQQTNQGRIKELLESIMNIKNTNIFQVHISYSSNLTRSNPNKLHVHINACLTSLTLLHHNTYTSMHDHINACSQSKQEMERNLNLAC